MSSTENCENNGHKRNKRDIERSSRKSSVKIWLHYFDRFFTSRGLHYLKPREGGSLLVLSEMIDFVIVSVSENIPYSLTTYKSYCLPKKLIDFNFEKLNFDSSIKPCQKIRWHLIATLERCFVDMEESVS